MSRYNKTVKKDGKTVHYAWGYDAPCQEYFFQCFKDEEDLSDDEESDVIFSISSVHTLTPHPDHPGKMKWSNGQIIELMQKYTDEKGECVVPMDHRTHIALDLPF